MSAVFLAAALMNVLAAIMALAVLKPLRAIHDKTADSAPTASVMPRAQTPGERPTSEATNASDGSWYAGLCCPSSLSEVMPKAKAIFRLSRKHR